MDTLSLPALATKFLIQQEQMQAKMLVHLHEISEDPVDLRNLEARLQLCNAAQLLSQWLNLRSSTSYQDFAIKALHDALQSSKESSSILTIPIMHSLLDLLSRNISQEGFTFEAFIMASLALDQRGKLLGK